MHNHTQHPSEAMRPCPPGCGEARVLTVKGLDRRHTCAMADLMPERDPRVEIKATRILTYVPDPVAWIEQLLQDLDPAWREVNGDKLHARLNHLDGRARDVVILLRVRKRIIQAVDAAKQGPRC